MASRHLLLIPILFVCMITCRPSGTSRSAALSELTLTLEKGYRHALMLDAVIEFHVGVIATTLVESTEYEFEVIDVDSSNIATVDLRITRLSITPSGGVDAELRALAAKTNEAIQNAIRDTKVTLRINNLGEIQHISGTEKLVEAVRSTMGPEPTLQGSILLMTFEVDAFKEQLQSFFMPYTTSEISSRSPYEKRTPETVTQFSLVSVTSDEIMLSGDMIMNYETDGVTGEGTGSISVYLDRKNGWPLKIEETSNVASNLSPDGPSLSIYSEAKIIGKPL